MGSVYAFRTELDAWVRRRSVSASPEPECSGVAHGPRTIGGGFGSPHPLAVALGLMAAVGAAAAILGGSLWLRSPPVLLAESITDARFQRVTDFDAVEQAAAVSRDGRLVAFLSDRDGRMDVWITQVGSGSFHNLTRGSAPELVNPSVRPPGLLARRPPGHVLGSQADRSGNVNDASISKRRVGSQSPSPVESDYSSFAHTTQVSCQLPSRSEAVRHRTEIIRSHRHRTGASHWPQSFQIPAEVGG